MVNKSVKGLPVLSNLDDDLFLWKTQMKLLLRSKGLERYIHPMTNEGTGTKENIKTWEKESSEAAILIFKQLDGDIQREVALTDPDSAYKIWSVIHDLFKGSNGRTKAMYLSQLFKLKFKEKYGCEQPTEWVRKL